MGDNHLSGTVPLAISGLSLLTYVTRLLPVMLNSLCRCRRIVIGTLLNSAAIPVVCRALDLEANNVSGVIPDTLGSLMGLR